MNTLAQILWKNAEENGLKQEEKDKIYESSLHYAHAAYKIATEDVNKIPNTMKFNYMKANKKLIKFALYFFIFFGIDLFKSSISFSS